MSSFEVVWTEERQMVGQVKERVAQKETGNRINQQKGQKVIQYSLCY